METLKLSRREFLTYAGITSSGLLLGCSSNRSIISSSAAIKFLPW